VVVKIVTTKTESSDTVEGFERALPYYNSLPYLEQVEYDVDRNVASVGKMADLAYFVAAVLYEIEAVAAA